MTTDPVCGMPVYDASALRAERDGETFYFCGQPCRQKFLSAPAPSKKQAKESHWDPPPAQE
jgi:Cu+-exporting ATPase